MNAAALSEWLKLNAVEQIRFAWCDLNGITRCKTIQKSAATEAWSHGVGIPCTLALKDTSDRTAVPVFTEEGAQAFPAYAGAANLILRPIPESLRVLPWAPKTAWVQCELFHQNGRDCELDSRRVLRKQMERMQRAGRTLRCGLEIEFHVYRQAADSTDPAAVTWPAAAPQLTLLHPGFTLLSEQSADSCHEVFELISETCRQLKLPLQSIEIEFGPSQFEVVFDVADALTAADHMVLFRSAVRQVLKRHGYHASFMCRPPFETVMASGWHLHHSVWRDGKNEFSSPASWVGAQHEPSANTSNALGFLSPFGKAWLAGLIDRTREASLLCTPTPNGYSRYRPNSLAPTHVRWGLDDRGALFRLIKGNSPLATRIENRLGEPAANPYLYMAATAICGLEGVEAQRELALDQHAAPALTNQFRQAIAAFSESQLMKNALGHELHQVITMIRSQEANRFEAAKDPGSFYASEYLGRI